MFGTIDGTWCLVKKEGFFIFMHLKFLFDELAKRMFISLKQLFIFEIKKKKKTSVSIFSFI